MSKPTLSIITASAGTGKTYRLALEYVRIVLDFYGKSDFTLDNILVLTFTRKATAEIRERIVGHLELLCSNKPSKANDRHDLLAALYPEQQVPTLESVEQVNLSRALAEISSDRKQLQVMTIDAYINSIFCNIVRPLRSIDTFDIDQQAVDKRMPFLLDLLMTSDLRARLDSLLRRKVSPSLDEYRKFFASMIDARWLYYLIESQHSEAPEDTLRYHKVNDVPIAAVLFLDNALDSIAEILDILSKIETALDIQDMFNAGFKSLFLSFPSDFPALLHTVTALSASPQGCRRLFRAMKSSLYNGGKIKGAKHLEATTRIKVLQDNALLSLADYIMHTMFLAEQQEILAIWKAILDEYDKLIYRYKNMTYNDVAWFTLEALFKGESPEFDIRQPYIATEFYQFLSHRSRFILIDEFQDTSLMQFSILKPIIEEVTSGEGSRDFSGLIVVGDEKQSIFGWRGGERDLLLNLRAIFPTLSEIQPQVLRESFRSSKVMMDFINTIFLYPGIHEYLRERQLNWQYEAIQSAVPIQEYPSQIEFITRSYSHHNPDESLDTVMKGFVRNSIKPALTAYPEQSVAILCRKGSELSQMQQLLEEAGVPSIFQPSSILPNHNWVSPLIAWLRFLAFRDWLDFLEVLRSNYIMLKSAPLKTILDIIAKARENDLKPDFSAYPLVHDLYLYSSVPNTSLSEACSLLVDRFTRDKEPSERDFLNIHAFISLIQDFELNSAERDKTIPAFLDYLDDNLEQEFMKQVAVEGRNTLQLLTIHKSKGLQFDRVFVFYNLSGKGGNDNMRLKWFVDYATPDFQVLNDYALTYHYEDLLANSSYSSLARIEENRELLEEMNTLYVAFTRAKTALHICMIYLGSTSWEDKQAKRKAQDIKLPHLLADASISYFSHKDIAASADGSYHYQENPVDITPKAETRKPDLTLVIDNLISALPSPNPDPFAGITPNIIDEHKGWKKIWLTDRLNLFGDLAHHYLSYIRHNLPEEHSIAVKQCLSRFGSILTQDEILATLERLRNNLPANKIFPLGYDKVFTEFTIFSAGRELRMDRLLLDTGGKRALILDYKTGQIIREEQLEEYRRALMEMEVIQGGNYSVDIEYVHLEI